MRTTECKLSKHKREFCRVVIDLALEITDVSVAAADGIMGAHVGLVDDGAHGLVALEGVEVADDLDDVTDAEETVSVEELLLLVGGEVRSEEAVGFALAALVFAGCAGGVSGGLGGGALIVAAAAGAGVGGSCIGCGGGGHDRIEGCGVEGGTRTHHPEEEEEEEEEEEDILVVVAVMVVGAAILGNDRIGRQGRRAGRMVGWRAAKRAHERKAGGEEGEVWKRRGSGSQGKGRGRYHNRINLGGERVMTVRERRGERERERGKSRVVRGLLPCYFES